jgi:hypothetical protein
MIMRNGKQRRGAWIAGAVIAVASTAALLSPGLASAAQSNTRPANTRLAAREQGEAVHIIGHRVIDGKTYPVIYVRGDRNYGTKNRPDVDSSSTMVNYHSGKCGEVYGSQTGNGANVDQWTCNGTHTQDWYFDLWGTDQYGNEIGNIININSGKCFEVYNWGAGNGSNVDQWNCAPLAQSHTNQLWDLNGPFLEAVGATQYRNLVVVAEVNGWSTANKGNVDIWQSYADANQEWHYSFGD